MVQESWKIDNEDPGCQPPEGPRLCYNNCGFFGSSTTMNLCSQCYRDVVLKQAKATEAAAVISSVHSELPVPGIGRQPQPEATVADEGSSSQSVEAESSKAALPSEQLPLQPNRCFSCKKHLGLLGFKCRCGYLFCSLHRYNDKHNCSFDYRAAARDAIAKANPVVKADKLDKI